MNPSISLVNCTPSSTALVSAALGPAGTAPERQMLVHGHSFAALETTAPPPAASRLPLSSIERLLIVADPGAPGVQSKLHRLVPVAAFQVAPPSTETSTPATMPPPWSTAVPVIVTRLPLATDPPLAGETTVDTG